MALLPIQFSKTFDMTVMAGIAPVGTRIKNEKLRKNW